MIGEDATRHKISTFDIKSPAVTATQGVAVTQVGHMEWTFTINSMSITASEDVSVVQENGFIVWSFGLCSGFCGAGSRALTKDMNEIVTQDGYITWSFILNSVTAPIFSPFII